MQTATESFSMVSLSPSLPLVKTDRRQLWYFTTRTISPRHSNCDIKQTSASRFGIFKIKISHLVVDTTIPMTCRLHMMLIRCKILLLLRGRAGFGVICILLVDLERLIKMETSRIPRWWCWYIEMVFRKGCWCLCTVLGVNFDHLKIYLF